MYDFAAIRYVNIVVAVSWYLASLFFFINGGALSKNICPVERSFTNSTTSSSKFIWKSSGVDNEIIISHPPCMNQSDILITRVCRNRSWYPNDSPICSNSRKQKVDCSEDNGIACIFASEPQPWDEKCQHDTQLNYTIGNLSIWLPIQRKIKFGPYEITSFGRQYGQPIRESYKISYDKQDIFKKNCLVMNNRSKEIFPTDCKEAHSHICPLDVDDTVCPNNCASAGLGNQKCYCKVKGSRCTDSYAEIRTRSDLTVLMDLVENDECYLGDPISSDLNFNGFRQSLRKKHWSYTNRILKCSLCLVTVPRALSHVKMVLNFDEKVRELHLIIYSPQNLLYNADENFVYCFTDAAGEPKKKVKVKKRCEHFGEDNQETTFFSYKVELEPYVGYYWCEAYKNDNFQELISSNSVIAYKNKTGNEYSLRLVINDVCEIFNCSKIATIQYSYFIHENITIIFNETEARLRVVEVFDFDFKLVDFLLHVTTQNHRDIVEEYYEFRNQLNSLKGKIQVLYFKSSEFCLPDDLGLVTWPISKIRRVVVPNEICVQENGQPVTRMCSGNFKYGSQWSPASGECQVESEPSEVTKYIYAISNENISEAALVNISKIVKNAKLSVLDIYFLTKIFMKMNNVNKKDIEFNLLNIMDNLLNVNSTLLVEAQNVLNATDELLDSLQDIIVRPMFLHDKFLLQKNSFIVHISKPSVTNISGVILYSKNGTIFVDDFKRDTTFDNIPDKEDLIFAVHVPDSQLEEWFADNSSEFAHLKDIYIITTIFFNNGFFGGNSNSTAGPIVDVVIPGYENYLQNTIPVWFKTTGQQHSPSCGFWDYGKKTKRHKGRWSTVGGNYLGIIDTKHSIHACSYSHLTHFALLIVPEDLSNDDQYALALITCIGDLFSVFGITGIFATAVLFDSWRRKQGTKILLNLSVAILLEILFTFLIQLNLIVSDENCKILGPILHYTIISKYCWMLVYAFLQYMRFVKVFGPTPNNIILKSALIGWGLPAIPVLSISFLNPYSYSSTNYLTCYPVGLPLYLALLAPVLLIIVANTIVFYIIMKQVTTKTTEVYSNNMDASSSKLQLQLGALLFFVLGIPLLFGVLSSFTPIVWLQTTLVYVLCLTSNLQGFVLFVFYVVLNKETRRKWIQYYSVKRKLSMSLSSRSKS